MTKEEFVHNYICSLGLVVANPNYPDGAIIKAITESLYDHQQMIEYLDNRIIDLERMVYAS